MMADDLAQIRVFNVVDAADVERGVGPGALGDLLDDVTDPASTLDKQHVALLDLKDDPLKIAEWRILPGTLLVEPADHWFR